MKHNVLRKLMGLILLLLLLPLVPGCSLPKFPTFKEPVKHACAEKDILEKEASTDGSDRVKLTSYADAKKEFEKTS